MSAAVAVPLFLVSLGVTLAAARLFARRLDRLGVRFGFPEALIGLLTAVAADGPEIWSALFALAKGAHDVGVGVLVGSNGFNLAAMIGVSALVTGRVRLARETLLFEGTVGLIITLLASALLLRWLSPAGTTIASAVVAVPYLTVVVAEQVPRSLPEPPVPGAPRARRHRSAPGHVERPDPPPAGLDRRRSDLDRRRQRRHGAVRAQPRRRLAHLGCRARLPDSGPADKHPQRADRGPPRARGPGRGAGGRDLQQQHDQPRFRRDRPVAVRDVAAVSTLGKLQLAWLIGATLFTMAALARPGGMNRPGGAVLVILYFAFVAGTLVGS